MSDFKSGQYIDNSFVDMPIANGDFELGNDLETAVLVSLFSNRRGTDEEVTQYARGTIKPELAAGLWIDSYRSEDYGSGFWLLLREKKIEETLSRFEEYGNAALAWMLRDGVAQSIDITAEYEGEKVKLNVVISRDTGGELTFTYDFAWDQLFLPPEAIEAAPSTPPITGDAILWLTPDLSSIGATDPISPWIDIGLAPAENATEAVFANRPALIADIANGYAGARFDGVNDTLNAPLVLPLPWTQAIAGAFTKPTSKKYILGKAGTGGIYIAPVTGFVGVDLGGTGIEGATDRSGSMINVQAKAEDISGPISASDDFT
jgi:phage gp46-like protein